MENNIYVSICIPTYNRGNKVIDLINSILKYNYSNIEVVVVDNCSTDDTEFLVKQLIDERLVYIKNQTNIGGVPNVISSLQYANGKYVLLCLDKDKIDPNNIALFINRVKVKENIAFGQCKLNCLDLEFEDIIYEKGLNSLEKLAFSCEHPSGLFFNNELLKKENIIQKILSENKDFAFNPDLIKAELSYLGNSTIINIPFVHTETLEECENEVSHTYKGSNIYFLPRNVIKRYNVFIKKINSLEISSNDKVIISKKLYFSHLFYCVYTYKEIMKNKSVCAHHCISTKNCSLIESVESIIYFNINYLFVKSSETIVYKLKNILIAQITIITRIMKK